MKVHNAKIKLHTHKQINDMTISNYEVNYNHQPRTFPSFCRYELLNNNDYNFAYSMYRERETRVYLHVFYWRFMPYQPQINIRLIQNIKALSFSLFLRLNCRPRCFLLYFYRLHYTWLHVDFWFNWHGRDPRIKFYNWTIVIPRGRAILMENILTTIIYRQRKTYSDFIWLPYLTYLLLESLLILRASVYIIILIFIFFNWRRFKERFNFKTILLYICMYKNCLCNKKPYIIVHCSPRTSFSTGVSARFIL